MEKIKSYRDIVDSKKYQTLKGFNQHGDYSVYDHSLNVANTCYNLANVLHLSVNMDSLVKGALLHDYFLYDWHEKTFKDHHAIRHPKIACENAMRDFGLTKREQNMVKAHMFPLGLVIPRYRESIILCLVDKYCAVFETIGHRRQKIHLFFKNRY